MGHGWSRMLRPLSLGAAAGGLMLGALGAGAGVAGAATHHQPQPVYRFKKFVGGHGKAEKKLSPVTIGVVNQQTSTDALAPEWTTGVKIAVQYVDQHTHGIDGHPLRAVYCSIPTTVGSAAKCGEQFANDRKIAAVVAGAIDVGNTALETALAPSKKPIVFGVSESTVDEKDPNGFILYSGGQYLEPANATFAKKYLHAKSVSIVYPSDDPAWVSHADIIYNALKYEGVKTVYKVGYTSAETNLTAPFEAAHVASTTLVMAENSGGPTCSDTYLTLKSLGLANKKVLTTVPCDTPTIAKADGGHLPHGWYYFTANPLPGATTKAVAAFAKVATKNGKKALGENAWVADAFGQTLTVAKFDTKILKAHKKITPAAVKTRLQHFRGAVVQGAPHLHCGAISGAPAMCNDLASIYQNTAPTVMKPVALYIGPPKGFKVGATS